MLYRFQMRIWGPLDTKTDDDDDVMVLILVLLASVLMQYVSLKREGSHASLNIATLISILCNKSEESPRKEPIKSNTQYNAVNDVVPTRFGEYSDTCVQTETMQIPNLANALGCFACIH